MSELHVSGQKTLFNRHLEGEHYDYKMKFLPELKN